MLDGPKRALADGIANDRYVFWLGSGISREKMPDLSDLAKKLLCTLQGRIEQADPNCRYRKALERVVSLTTPSPEEWVVIDWAIAPDAWPVYDAIASRLVNNYARMLNVPVDGEDEDFMLWDVLDAATIYSNPAAEPDAEHLCLAALICEGVASQMPSANWDPLVERAIAVLAGGQPVLRVAIAPDDVRSNSRRGNLYKFHGCAQAAHDDGPNYRHLMVGRQSQINSWIADSPVMASFLTHLIVTKPTLMLGLSAQDANIQSLFVHARVQMAWPWPSSPPAYAFSENALGGDQAGLLQNVYRGAYTAVTRPQIEDEALVKAYAKPLLLSLYLHVFVAKLEALLAHCLEGLPAVDRNKLLGGLQHARDAVAGHMAPTPELVRKLIVNVGRTISMLRGGSLPTPAKGLYSPLTPEPVDRMPADPNLATSGLGEFAVASSLIGLGLQRGLWSSEAADLSDDASGAFVVHGRSGPARIYFAAGPHAAIRLGTNGLIADNDDAVIVHSHEIAPQQARTPRRAPGRTGLASLREVSIQALLEEGTEVEDLMERFRSKIAL
ncbi:SIR2 family protein [Mesorhizobium sp. B283B1A]|uniref:SIR2 family protein n=1 Tax=Mesorhizobium TaxID=68287 RepID=UPI001CD0BDF2|nr:MULTISPECIES: SIR2 family protein [Mesorhizobium]MCA0050623.1 SIR2 family protein [Mesorhizobium sp. B283B1A]UQS66945.1 SIR2 family protein [Mesorhizobium opportunistum]